MSFSEDCVRFSDRLATLVDAGGYYHFKQDGLQFLFAYGHSVAGEAENFAYVGLYKTWGKKDDKAAGNAMLAQGMTRRPHGIP